LQFAENSVADELDARPTIVAEKLEDAWRIIALQNTRISEVGGGGRAGL
jgi:hypothetical protein